MSKGRIRYEEWQVKPQQPSPGPWKWREMRVPVPFSHGERMSVYVVLDANGRYVAECERAVDAEYISHCGPRPAQG